MATSQEHQRQWLRNRAFLREVLLTGAHPDWLTTITFYTALHAVQALLIFDGQRVFNHESRNIVLKERRYDRLWPDYKILYDAARVARYDCSGWLTFEGVQKELVKNRLLRLEQQVIKLAKLKVDALDDLLASAPAPPSK